MKVFRAAIAIPSAFHMQIEKKTEWNSDMDF
jgi:hypothetical protein